MIFNENDSKKLLEKIARYSKADGISLNLHGYNNNNIRFANNSLSTNGYNDGLTLRVKSYLGKKSGSASTENFNDENLKDIVKLSENIAKLSPDNPEFVPLLGKQEIDKGINYSENTKNFKQSQRIELIKSIIDKAIAKDLNSAGYLADGESFSSTLNSNGLFGYNQSTSIDFSSTVRTKDGTGSSRIQKLLVDSAGINISSLSEHVVNRSVLSANPKELKPGKYTVILEPDAAADMIAYLTFFMDERSADEGRSFFSKKGGGNRINEKLVNENVYIYSDPLDKNNPSSPFNDEGFPVKKTVWVNNGKIENLMRSRYWALKNNNQPIPFPTNIIMRGTDKSTEKLIESTDYGILVSRLWYIRTVDPKTILLTGLTRDGIFEIRDGKITNSIKNFRFNESPVNILSNVIEIGKSEKASGSETADMNTFVPALKIQNFNFSSISDAI